MAWSVEIAESAARELTKLDAQHRKRILKFLHDRLKQLDNPRSIGKALQGSRLGEFWKYRVGDYRIVARIEDERVVIVVIRVGHRKEVYR